MLHSLLDLIPIFFCLMFAVAFGLIIGTAVKASREKKANDAAPVQELEARVASRRSHVSSALQSVDRETADVRGLTARVTHYITFQMQNGEEMELQVSAADYEQLTEGEQGVLSLQGSRYLGFTRQRKSCKQE